LEEPEVQSITTALLGYTSQKIGPPAAKVLSAHEVKAEEAYRVIHQYNCQGCHNVQRLFQDIADDDPNKETHDKLRYTLEGRVLKYYSEDETLGPPPIYGEGRKVLSSWLYDFLQGPYPLRGRLKIRMPTFQFHNEVVNNIVRGWANEGEVDEFEPPQKANLSGQQLATAKTLFTRLQCLNCHSVSDVAVVDPEGSRGLAPSFALTARRLRRNWIVDWLKDPQKIQPGTRMPGFWPEGNSPAPDLLEGNSQAQMELLADYIIYLGQDKTGSPRKAATAENSSPRRKLRTARSE
jgi:cytochrome c551/c552